MIHVQSGTSSFSVELNLGGKVMSSSHESEPGHGSSIAAWTTVVVVIIAFAIGTLFFFLDNAIVVWLSAALALAGVGIGYYLKTIGYGVGGDKAKK